MSRLFTLMLLFAVSNSAAACAALSPCNEAAGAARESVATNTENLTNDESAGETNSVIVSKETEERSEGSSYEVTSAVLLAQNTSSTIPTDANRAANVVKEVASTPEPVKNSASAELLALLKDSQQMRAQFQQEMRDERGQLIDQSSGRVRWKKPLSFRWDIERPFRQSIVVHEGKHYQYDEDLEQLIVRNLSEEVAALPRVILSGDESAIQENYRVKKIRAVAAIGGGINDSSQAMFQLEPLPSGSATQSEVQAVLLVFENTLLTEISVVDSLQQTSRFDLTEQVLQGVSESDFELDLPDGIEIIHQ